MAEEADIVCLPYGRDKMCVMKILPFSTELDVEDVLKIDYSNPIGEMLTFPVILNKIMLLRAEMQNAVSKSKMELESFVAELTENKRNELNRLGGKVTISEVESAVKRDPGYHLKSNQHYEVVKNYDYADALYWSAQAKVKMLEVYSNKLSPVEFEKEILETTINHVMIKSKKAAIV